jgi:S-DNA-T family DNA segregation ATPase FtsK/SpoIIIE
MFAQQAQARAAHLAMTPTIAQALADLRHQHAALWSVRPTHPDAFFVSIGFGEQSWTPQFRKADHISDDLRSVIERARHLDRVPVPMVLESGTFTAVVGDVAVAAATVRSMVIQLAASSGPADWQLAVITDNDDEWRCLSWLAHLTDNAGAPRIVQSNNVADFTASVDMNDHRLLVLVVDRAEVFAARTSAVRRLIAGTRPVAVLLCCASARDVPALATRMLKLGPHSIGSWTADTRSQSAPLSVHVAGLSRVNAHDAAAAAAHLIDPEIEGESTAIPQAVSLMDLLGVDDYDSDAIAACLVAQWQGVGRQPAPCTPIGVAADGMVEIDLAADGPHALLAGTTGAGKSELLRSMVIGLATRLRPDEINFVLIDYKGGATFDACVDLPHVVGLVTDLDDRLGSRALRSMDAELRRREGLLRDAGASDLDTFRSMAARSSARPASLPVLPRLVVVIDEFATLAVQQPEFIGALLGIAQRGRSLGVHLVLATQRPGGVISDDIRANTNLRIALRVQDAADSNDVIGDPGAAMLPRGRAGRAILRLANDELIPFQTARSTGPVRDNARDGALWVQRTPDRTAQSCEGDVAKPAHLDESSELAVMARAVGIATRLASIAQPYRPWLPPLETVIERTTIDPRAVGVLDDPDRQRRVPLTWHRGDGHLLIVGASGMGATSALLSLATLTHVAEPDSELFIIDAMGDARLKALDLGPGCATVVGVHERERLTRLLALVDAERLSRKSGCAAAPGGIMLMIDGIGALRAELEAHDCFDQLAQLDAILTDGQSVDISVAVTATQPGAVPSHLLSLIAQRWMLHLADPFDASMLGVPFSLMPEAVPGRMLDVRTRLEGQLAIFEASSATLIASAQPSRRASRPLRSLPTSVDVGELPQSSRRGDDVALAVGLTYAHVEPSMLTIPSGEHVLVVGPYRSGRTSALRTIARGWAEVHSEGWIGCVAPRRSSIRQGRAFAKVCELAQELPPDGDALIIVDDAELVDDPSGVLASLTSSRRDGLTVVAAARPEALRASYGHWTGAVRRSRLGLVMAACADIDGDLLNVVVPRRLPVAARPGLAWLVADGGSQLVQLARETGRDFAGADRVIT